MENKQKYIHFPIPLEEAEKIKIIDLSKHTYCNKSVHGYTRLFSLHLSYGIDWYDTNKVTIFLKLTPNKGYAFNITKFVPIKYTAGGEYNFFIETHSMTCSIPSSLWMIFSINKTKFKTPTEMYNYILNNTSILIENDFIELYKITGHINEIK